MNEESKTPKGRRGGRKPAEASPLPAGGILSAAGTGGGDFPAALFSTDLAALEADVSGELGAVAPTFGDVLFSLGQGVAASQEALDRSLTETARQLSDTKITVVNEVVQTLDDDGLPDLGATELIENEVSLINYVAPTVHEWRRMALSMDLTVGELDNERGFTFNRRQRYIGARAYGLLWGFIGWFDTDDRTEERGVVSRFDYEADWSAGQVRMDALLGPRRSEPFPVPAEVAIGPQIFFSQGSVTETLADGVPTERQVDLLIKVRKADGSVNPNVNLELESDLFTFSFYTEDGYTGSQTNAEGEVKVRVIRNLPSPRFTRPIRGQLTARLGQIKRSLTLSL